MHLCVSCPLVHACRVFAQTVIPDDGDAAIVLKQVKAETDDDRSRIYRDAVVSAYAAAVIENELEKGDVPVPVKPAEGVGADSAYGPFYIYGRLGACRRFAEEVPVLVLDTPQVQLVVEVLDLSAEEKPSSGKVKISEKQMQSLFVHVSSAIPNGEAFKRLHASNYKKAWQSAGFFVAKSTRQNLSIDGKSTNIKIDKLHANIRPLDGPIRGAHFPGIIEVQTAVMPYELNYVIHDHPSLNGIICQKICHKYRMHYLEYYNINADPCACDEKSKEPASKKQRITDDAFRAAAAVVAANNAQKPCPFFGIGTCQGMVAGKKCRYIHPHGVDPRDIQCKHAKKKGVCAYGERCQYGK